MNPGSIEAKKQHIADIARMIYDHPGSSRKELGQRFSLSPSTVTLAVNALMAQKLIADIGHEESAAGRKARLLQIHAEAGSILVIRLDGDLSVQLRLCNLCGQRLAEQTIDAPAQLPTQAEFPALLTGFTADFLSDLAFPPLIAAAVIIPGVMNPDGTADLPVLGWSGLQLQALQDALQVPVYCDTILRMLSGYEVQQHPPADRQIYLSLEPGVGMSCHEHGQAVTSRNLLYGEVGHISMHENGPVCYCGNRGCLEYYCGIPGMLSRMAEQAHSCPILQQMPNSLEGLTAAATHGSSAARELLQEAATELGRALVTIRNMLDPDQIIISGRLWQIDLVRSTALELVRSRTLSGRQNLPLFLTAALPPDRYEIGVCRYVFTQWVDHIL